MTDDRMPDEKVRASLRLLRAWEGVDTPTYWRRLAATALAAAALHEWLLSFTGDYVGVIDGDLYDDVDAALADFRVALRL